MELLIESFVAAAAAAGGDDAAGLTAMDLDCVITMADCGDELLYSVQLCLHHHT